MPAGITQQDIHRQLFTSHERTANIEHLLHMDRLAEVRLSERKGIVGHDDIDFRSPPAVVNPSISVAMANKLKSSYEHEEARIHKENEYLMQRLLVHASDEQRVKHHVNLMPLPQEKPFREQGSNIVSRRREAERMAEANEVLMYAMATVKPSVSNRAIAASVKKHNERVKQISKFRPAAEYAGARELRGDMKLILAPGAIAEPASGSSSAQQRSPRRPEWQHLSPHDVRRHRWITDRSVRSVFTRDEDEVLSEAAETFKHSDVTVQRLTWSDIGKQVAANLSPSRRGSKQLSNTARSTNSSTGPNNHHGTSYKQIQASPREQQQTCTSGTMGTTFGSGMILPALPPPPSSSSSSSRHPTGRGAPQPQQQDPSVEQPHRPQLQEQHNEDRGDTTRRPPTQEEGSSARKPAAPQLPSSTILSASGRKKPTGGDSAHIPVPPASSGSSQQGRRRSSVSKDNAASASSSRHPTHSIDKDLKVFQDGDLYVVST